MEKRKFHIRKRPDQNLDGPLPWALLKRIPDAAPLLFLGSHQSAFSLIALSFDEETQEDFMLQGIDEKPAAPGLSLGQVALLTYDAYNPWCDEPAESCRFFRIRQSLVVDQRRGELYHCWEDGFEDCRYQVPWPDATLIPTEAPTMPCVWTSSWNDARYMETVIQAIEEIKDGRYYQINLLRYWEGGEGLQRSQFIRRLQRFSGPFSAYIDLPDLGLVSWSPERFIHGFGRRGRTWLETMPIKGTRPVLENLAQNEKQKTDLQNSQKDRAELHMIVDLMRNDLHRVSVPGGVKVIDQGSLHSFPNVHHLVAKVSGQLKSRITIDELCRALCPGGSITGAPKREVMDAIRAWEERERGYFMGNIVYRDSYSGRLDSSILIRTAVRKRSGSAWEYAAGSGITIKSTAKDELDEVLAKARIILENPW